MKGLKLVAFLLFPFKTMPFGGINKKRSHLCDGFRIGVPPLFSRLMRLSPTGPCLLTNRICQNTRPWPQWPSGGLPCVCVLVRSREGKNPPLKHPLDRCLVRSYIFALDLVAEPTHPPRHPPTNPWFGLEPKPFSLASLQLTDKIQCGFLPLGIHASQLVHSDLLQWP